LNNPNPPITDNLISVRLIDAYKHVDSCRILFDLLLERDTSINISHKKMPTWREHVNFFESKPYRKWYLIEAVSWDTAKKIELEPGSMNYATAIVGACYLTRMNEVGIFLFRQYQGRGFAIEALNKLITKHKPMQAITGRRSGRFIANINPKNEKSIRLFTKLGFTHNSNTYIL